MKIAVHRKQKFTYKSLFNALINNLYLNVILVKYPQQYILDKLVSKGTIKISLRKLIFQLKDNKIPLPDDPLIKKQLKRYIEELSLWLRLIRICDVISKINPNYNIMVDFKAVKYMHDGFYLAINQESLSTTSLNKMILLLNRANKFYFEIILNSKIFSMFE